MKPVLWLCEVIILIICQYYVLVNNCINCYSIKLKLDIELRNYTWKNMDKVQSFFSKVFPIQYSEPYFMVMMYGDLVKLAFHGKEMIGFLYSHADPADSDVLVIASIGCLPKYRRHGVGSYLLEYALNYAEKKGIYKTIRLFVQTRNNVALKFYKKFGFKIVNHESDYYMSLVDADAYKMEKIIHPQMQMQEINSTNSYDGSKNLVKKNDE